MKNYLLLLSIMLLLFGTYTGIRSSSASPGVISMVALGDSITYGIGDPAKKGYIEGVKGNIEEKMNTPVRLSNFAIPRYTTDNILEQLQDQKIIGQIKKADYIFLFIGTNDFRKSANHQFNPLNVKRLNEGKGRFAINLYKIIENIRIDNPKAPIFVLGLYQPYIEYQNHQEILDSIQEWNREIVNVIGEFDQITFVPTLDLFQNKPKSTYLSDSLHPNPAGYKLIKNRLTEKMLSNH